MSILKTVNIFSDLYTDFQELQPVAIGKDIDEKILD